MAKTTEPNEKQNRIHTVKVRMTDDEYDNFTRRCKAFQMTQSAMIRSALSGSVVRPVIRVSPINQEKQKERNAAKRIIRKEKA